VVAGVLSPVWKGGALFKTLDFSKVLVAWVLTFVVITSFARLRRIIFIQSASVVVIAIVSLLKGRDHPRLEGVIGGIYSNPNDLAFAIVLSLPFCLAFLLYTKKLPRKLAWVLAMLAMFTALFLTASRGGFVTLLATAMVCLWHFGVKGKRPQLIAAALLVGLMVGVTAGGRLKDRFFAISGENLEDPVDLSAHGSYEQRRLLMERSLEGVMHHPLGIGLGNFANYSGTWRQVHVAYLQIAVEGGIAAGIFYLLFFWRGFANLRQLRRIGKLDEETDLLVGALHSSLIGFVVGALFSPEAYQFFPYFAVAYTSVLLAIAQETVRADGVAANGPSLSQWQRKYRNTGDLTLVR
jgi:putative inorganic carbon (HCO3(-)) transporter